MSKGAWREGRGEVAVSDMKARLADGWTFDMLWARTERAERDGYVYDYVDHTAFDLNASLRALKVHGHVDDDYNPEEDDTDD